MQREQGPIDPEIKKELEEEGFEDNAAVVVGSKEEAERARERIEAEGRTENVEAYLRLHKEVKVPESELEEATRFLGRQIKTGETVCRGLWNSFIGRKNIDKLQAVVVRYLDSDRNLSEVRIEPGKIGELENILDSYKFINQVLSHLHELGFNIEQDSQLDSYLWIAFDRAVGVYKEKLEAEARERKVQEFDF